MDNHGNLLWHGNCQKCRVYGICGSERLASWRSRGMPENLGGLMELDVAVEAEFQDTHVREAVCSCCEELVS